MESTGSAASGGNGTFNPQINDAPPTDSTVPLTTSFSDDPKQNLNQVINSIQKTLGTIHQLYLTVSSFNVSSQLPLLQRLNTLVKEMDNMAKLSEKCNIQVPIEVLNLIDDGKNPDEFTRDVLNSCIVKNQVTKGKTDAFKHLAILREHVFNLVRDVQLQATRARMVAAMTMSLTLSGEPETRQFDSRHWESLRRHLLEELEQAFPDEVEHYREIQASSGPESLRLAQAQSILQNGDVKVKPEM